MIGKHVAIPAIMLLIFASNGCGTPDARTEDGQRTTAPTPATTTVPTPATTTATTTPEDLAALSSTIVATADSSACSATLASLYQGVDTIEELAWMSHQVALGTVVEQQPSEWGDSPNPLNSASRVIYTNYVVHVEQQLRGQPLGSIIVRQMGGTIGACTQMHESEPSLTIGDKLLLFLREAEPPSATLAYDLVGGPQGFWEVNSDGMVMIDVGQLEQYNGMPLAAAIGLVQTSLAGPPPDSPLAPEYFVPIDQAPVPTPISVTTPAP